MHDLSTGEVRKKACYDWEKLVLWYFIDLTFCTQIYIYSTNSENKDKSLIKVIDKQNTQKHKRYKSSCYYIFN